MTELQQLRGPTRYERFVYRLTDRWPQRYVDPRLDNLFERELALRCLPPAQALRAVMRDLDRIDQRRGAA